MVDFTEPAKGTVTFTEPQWIFSEAEATWADIANATWADFGDITWAGLNSTYGSGQVSHKVNAPTYTEPTKGTTVFTEPSK